jgi:hypothetical protein
VATHGYQIFLFHTKNPNLGIPILEGLVCNGKCLYILWPFRVFGIFYDILESFVLYWYIFSSFCNVAVRKARKIVYATVVKIYNTTSSLVRFENKNIFFYNEKLSALWL